MCLWLLTTIYTLIYPDEYKYKIGKSYNDYVAFHQQSLFENLEEYTDTTVAATPTAPLLDKGENDEQ